MTQVECAVCARELPDQAYVCDRCAAVVGEDLVRAATLAGEVETTVSKLARHGAGGRGSGERPLLFDEKAAERASAIGNAFATVARHVAESRGLVIPRVPEWRQEYEGPLCLGGSAVTVLILNPAKRPCPHEYCEDIRGPFAYRRLVGVAVAAEWLAGHGNLRWLRHRKEGPELLGQLQAAARQLESLVGAPPPLVYRGPCYAELGDLDEADDEIRCQEVLYARAGQRTIRCRECGAEHDAETRRQWLLDQVRPTLTHAEHLARALTELGIEKVTASRIRGYAHRGRLLDRGLDAAGRPLYKVGEVLDLIDEQARVDAERAVKRELEKARREAKKRETAA